MLRAMADETRLTLLLLLAIESRTVKELHQLTGLSRTLISHHLAPLREQRLVTVFPKGRSNVYALCCESLREPARLLAALTSIPSAPGALTVGGEPPAATTDGTRPSLRTAAHP
ncbi:ArsR/SmtB family transcription factor [Streptomyces chumphonensis]|nr:metalloregulator ArsR/SmtB family transcription factor [Streptomyces chumphonensis]